MRKPVEKTLSEVKEGIKPAKDYEKNVLGKANKIIRKINAGLKNDATAILGGSGAKGTWLETFDVDIFVKFKYSKYMGKSDQLSDLLGKFLKKHFKVERLHGSRDYFQIKEDKYTFEIVPILDIKKAEDAENITDASPLHSKFVSKHKKLVGDIRLTKQFFKAAKAYGAESYIKGFSGYVCEILTIYYGSFLGLIRAVSRWKEKTVIDVKGYYKERDVFMELNKSKLESPIIVIDPVQKDRNAAAALSLEKFELARHRAREFLKNPSKDFFRIREYTEEEVRKRFGREKVVFVKAEPLNKKEDVAGAKMLKAFHFVEKQLSLFGFEIVESDMLWHRKKEAVFYYVLKNPKLAEELEVEGPPVKAKKHASAFKKKHKNAYVKNGRMFAVVKRKFTDARILVRSLLKSLNVKGNVERAKVV